MEMEPGRRRKDRVKIYEGSASSYSRLERPKRHAMLQEESASRSIF
jgi:hypothetical protein